MDFLKSAVASAISKGSQLPYSFGDRVTLEQSIWTLHNGTRKEDGIECSIFTFEIPTNRSRAPLARNAARKLRTLRHPGVIKVLDTVETTLAFIHDEAVSVHGNVRLASIFTSKSGEWRLGGFEILSSMKDDDAIIYTMGGLNPDFSSYTPPEIAKSGWEVIKRHPVPAADSYDFGVLIFEVFNGCLVDHSQIGQTKNVPPSMHQSYKRLLNANPKARLSISNFRLQGTRSGGYFDTSLIKLSEGIENLDLKSEMERGELLNELDEVADDFSEDYLSVKVLPELLKSVEFGGGGPRVFSAVVKIGSKLSDEDFNLKLTPVVVRLFSNPDRAIRVCLLDNLPNIIGHLPQKLVNDKIFSHMATGFADVAPLVREQTVKAVLTIITKLSDRTINGDLLKHLAKTANDEQPGIRTNTTICLGKIARNLGANTRQKVLTAAFTRSLRDPFVHARNAALQALAATSDLFSDEDCATKILPAICPSLIDKERLVRDQANKTFDLYVQRIRKYATTLSDSVLPNLGGNATNGTVTRAGSSQNGAGWTGWAISSFTNKLATASGDIEPNSTTLRSDTQRNRPSSVPPTADTDRPALTAASASKLHRQAVSRSPAPTDTRTSTDHLFDEAEVEDADVDQAWGDFGEDSFFDAPSEPKPTVAERKQPIVAATFDDGGEPDFEGWLKAQAQAKSKTVLPKGLSKVSATGANPPRITKATTTGNPGLELGGKKIAGPTSLSKNNTPTSIDTKPKDLSGEDDWGDAWD
ncbi:MAG: hypothetical protein Q9214_003787 [Letrouitia sp. 1 TL-2023]